MDLGYPEIFRLLRYATIFGVCLLIVFSNLHLLRVQLAHLSLLTPLVLLVLLGSISVLWSDWIEFSIQRAILFSSATLAAIVIGLKYSTSTIVKSLAAAFLIFVFAGIFIVIFFPEFGVENSWMHAGKWRGLSGQKNGFALTCSLSIVFVLATGEFRHRRNGFRSAAKLALILLLLFAIYKSGSRGGMASVSIILFIFGMSYLSARLSQTVFLVALLFAPPVIVVGMMIVEISGGHIIIGGLNIETSSRTLIWGYGFDRLQGHELFGMGIGSFWTPLRLQDFHASHGWALPNFHNGYVATFTELGLIGLCLVFWLAIHIVWSIAKYSRHLKRDGLVFISAALLMFLCQNLFENNLMRSTDIALMVFAISVAHFKSYQDLLSSRTNMELSNVQGKYA